jgi:hypothetical protein
MLNFLFRLGSVVISSVREEAARRSFDEHGRWPDGDGDEDEDEDEDEDVAPGGRRSGAERKPPRALLETERGQGGSQR